MPRRSSFYLMLLSTCILLYYHITLCFDAVCHHYNKERMYVCMYKHGWMDRLNDLLNIIINEQERLPNAKSWQRNVPQTSLRGVKRLHDLKFLTNWLESRIIQVVASIAETICPCFVQWIDCTLRCGSTGEIRPTTCTAFPNSWPMPERSKTFCFVRFYINSRMLILFCKFEVKITRQVKMYFHLFISENFGYYNNRNFGYYNNRNFHL